MQADYTNDNPRVLRSFFTKYKYGIICLGAYGLVMGIILSLPEQKYTRERAVVVAKHIQDGEWNSKYSVYYHIIYLTMSGHTKDDVFIEPDEFAKCKIGDTVVVSMPVK